MNKSIRSLGSQIDFTNDPKVNSFIRSRTEPQLINRLKVSLVQVGIISENQIQNNVFDYLSIEICGWEEVV